MRNLMVATFDNEFKANQMLLSLAHLKQGGRIDLDDAVVVVKNRRGSTRVQQTTDITPTQGALNGAWWGLLIGLLLGGPLSFWLGVPLVLRLGYPTIGWLGLPLLGVLAGMAIGALLGKLIDLGIDEKFIQAVAKTLEPGTSAILVLDSQGDMAALNLEFARFEGTILNPRQPESFQKIQEMLAASTAGRSDAVTA